MENSFTLKLGFVHLAEDLDLSFFLHQISQSWGEHVSILI